MTAVTSRPDALGGGRMRPYRIEDATVSESLALARAMTVQAKPPG
ncbi:hypothetical protein [Amycolatopsis sp. cmx-11-32]